MAHLEQPRRNVAISYALWRKVRIIVANSQGNQSNSSIGGFIDHVIEEYITRMETKNGQQ